MSDITKWLALHGLIEFESLFHEHKIDLNNLSSINENDLKEISVPLGDRKRIMKAIAGFSNQELEESATIGQSLHSKYIERRPLVVLFCDLVGSTEYATHLDPEDLVMILHPYRTTVKSIIEKHNGLTMIYEGDGIKAYFGSQVASEDDQEQALTAALEIAEVVPHMNLKHANDLVVRIGVATGTAIIGDFGSPGGLSAFGETLHLAARLQALAEPGSILVDSKTHKSMQSVFEFSDQGMHQLKGFDERVQAWKVCGKKKIDSRFAKRFRNTNLIGRRRELNKLIQNWNKAKLEVRGSVNLITGEAGIGKSRLAHELQRHINSEQSRSLLFQCSPYHTDSFYYPVLETFSEELGLNDKISGQQKIERLKEFLSGCDVPLDYSLRVFLNLFSLEGGGDAIVSDLSETMQENISRNVFSSHILRLCRQSPLLILIEDMQWIDATSSEFFNHLVKLSKEYPLVLVITSRNSESVGECDENITTMALNRLTPDESKALMSELYAGERVPEEFLQYIERKAEGIPLFIEELTSTVLDTGLKESEPGSTVNAVNELEMSSILQSSLLSKLDRLGKSKEIAQLAATIGREFSLDILLGITELSSNKLLKELEKLLDAEIIYTKKTTSSHVYIFKHALIQDTARNLVSRERRESTHRNIARVMQHLTPSEPELVAFHYNEGREFAKAADNWLAAGRKTAKSWAKQEALQQLNKGMEALLKSPESDTRLGTELEFQLEIGDVLYANFGYITDEGAGAYHRALELCERLNDHDAPVRALDGLFGMHFNSCHFKETLKISDRLIELGEDHDSISALVLGMQFKGMSLFCRGEFIEADKLLTKALDYINRANEVGSDFPSMALIYLSWTKYIRNLPNEAVTCLNEAMSIVQVQAAYRKAACLGDGCILYGFMDDPVKVTALVEQLIPMSERHGFNLWLNIANFFKGWSAARKGDINGLKQMEKMVEFLGDQEIDKSFYLGLLASAYIDFGQYDGAIQTITAGMAQVEATDENYYKAELYRLEARLNLKFTGDTERGIALLNQAISCAKEQSATSWLIRAEHDLRSVQV